MTLCKTYLQMKHNVEKILATHCRPTQHMRHLVVGTGDTLQTISRYERLGNLYRLKAYHRPYLQMRNVGVNI